MPGIESASFSGTLWQPLSSVPKKMKKEEELLNMNYHESDFFVLPVIIAAISVLKQPLCTSPLGSKAEMKFETFVKLLLLNESYESALK